MCPISVLMIRTENCLDIHFFANSMNFPLIKYRRFFWPTLSWSDIRINLARKSLVTGRYHKPCYLKSPHGTLYLWNKQTISTSVHCIRVFCSKSQFWCSCVHIQCINFWDFLVSPFLSKKFNLQSQHNLGEFVLSLTPVIVSNPLYSFFLEYY